MATNILADNKLSNVSNTDFANKLRQSTGLPEAIGSFKNKIVNGGFRVHQRGIGPFTYDTTSSGDGPTPMYTLDQWLNWGHSCAFEITHEDDYSFENIKFVMKHNYLDTNNSSDYIAIDLRQRLEFLHLYSGKTLTLSFEAKSTLPKDLKIFVGRKYNTTDAIIYTEVDHKTGWFDSDWKKYTVSFDVPTAAEDGNSAYDKHNSYLEIVIRHEFNDSNTDLTTTWIRNVQLEEGNIPTDFEDLSYDVSLLRCLRFYENLNNTNFSMYQDTASGNSDVSIFFKVRKRDVPICVCSGTVTVNGLGNSGPVSNVSITPNNVTIKDTNGIWQINFNTNSDMQNAGSNVIAFTSNSNIILSASSEL